MLASFLRQYPYSSRRAEAERLIDRLKHAAWMRRLSSRAAMILPTLLGLLLIYIAVSWILFSPVGNELGKADLIGGDITLPQFHWTG